MADIQLKDVIKQEYLKSAMDPSYCFGKYCNIAHPVQGKIKFKLYDFQKDTLSQFQKNSYNIVLKARQMGISTLVAAYVLWCMIFKNDFKVIVIATNQKTARNLVKKVQLMYEGLPSWLKSDAKIVENNKLTMTFSNGSGIDALSSSSSAARSEAVSLLIIDEAAFIENFKALWASSKMTLATGGDCILLSTPNGLNEFHTIWERAETGIIEDEAIKRFNPIRLKWDLHPERDESWRRQQDVDLGAALAAQECDCDFMTSGTNLIDNKTLQWYEQNLCEEPKERRGPGQELWIWKYVDYNKSYIVSADVARGDGADYSAMVVMEAESCEIVATFKSQIATREYGRFLVTVATEYNNALLVIDNKNIGWDVVNEAIDTGYDNVYYSYKQDPFYDENIQLRKKYDMKDKKDMVPGFTTTMKVRPVMISMVEHYYVEKLILTHCIRCIGELKTFVYINGKVQAMAGKNDDTCMATAQCLYVRDTALKLHSYGRDVVRKSIGGIKRAIVKSTPTSHSSWEMQLAKSKESLTWLI